MRTYFHRAMSGAVTERPELMAALKFARSGDTLVVWKLDRLARSVKQLIETVEKLRVAQDRLSESDGSHRHDDGARASGFSHVQRVGGIRASLIRERTQAGLRPRGAGAAPEADRRN